MNSAAIVIARSCLAASCRMRFESLGGRCSRRLEVDRQRRDLTGVEDDILFLEIDCEAMLVGLPLEGRDEPLQAGQHETGRWRACV